MGDLEVNVGLASKVNHRANAWWSGSSISTYVPQENENTSMPHSYIINNSQQIGTALMPISWFLWNKCDISVQWCVSW